MRNGEPLSVLEGDLVAAPPVTATLADSNASAATSLTTVPETVPEASESDADIDEIGAVHIVTAEDVAAARYTIDDIVLTLPGSACFFPSHAGGARWYAQVLKEDGFEIDIPSDASARVLDSLVCSVMRVDAGLHAVRGSYRHLICTARDFSYELKRYTHPDEQLVDTDADALPRGEGLPPPPPWCLRPAPSPAAEQPPHLALIAHFSLPKSAYATILMRELMRTDEVDAATAVAASLTTAPDATATTDLEDTSVVTRKHARIADTD